VRVARSACVCEWVCASGGLLGTTFVVPVRAHVIWDAAFVRVCVCCFPRVCFALKWSPGWRPQAKDLALFVAVEATWFLAPPT
jgi:hypothetical protein